MKNVQINAEKLQEVINAKNAETISKVKETNVTTKKSSPTKPNHKTTENEKINGEEKKDSPINKRANKESKIQKVTSKVKKNAEINLVEEVISKREVKYIYPEDCQDTLSRKKYRQKVRNELHRLELEMRRIEDKNSKEFKKKEKEYLAFKKKNLKNGAAA